MHAPEPQSEHQWLQRLVGEWVVEGECSMGPDQPPMKYAGREKVRSLGGLWTLGEGSNDVPGSGDVPGDGSCDSIMTLGYDPRLQRFVGTFVASMMTHLWTYLGTLDATGQVLTLDAEGPGFAGDGSLSTYQDIIEFVNDDHRVLRSQILGPDGQWQPFMKADYRRVG
jgi:hypothetical protein